MYPSIGVSQVSVAIKMLNATWISAMLQPCACRIGPTKSVQPYCRFAISTMQSTPSQSCTQRFGLRCAIADMIASRNCNEQRESPCLQGNGSLARLEACYSVCNLPDENSSAISAHITEM